MTKIHHTHLYGDRSTKYDWLLKNSILSTDWSELQPESPFYLLVPQDMDLWGEYKQGWKITEIMPTNVLGFQSHRDRFAIDFDRESLKARISEMRDPNITDEEYAAKYSVKNNRDWKIREARQKVTHDPEWEKHLINCAYRPFDHRPCYFSYVAMDCPRRELLDNVARRNNLCLNTLRQTKSETWQHAMVSDSPAPAVYVEIKDGSNIFPLYIYPNQTEFSQERRFNLAPKFLSFIQDKLKTDLSPESIFYYIYAIFYSPAYRTRYSEFLKIDFPLIPITKSFALFQTLSEYGEKLVLLHLMKSEKLGEKIIFFERASDRIVAPAHPKYKNGKVIINKQGDGFTGVPEEVWNFYIGGYQVCHKWLKDRKGRTLSDGDILHYQRIVVALKETITLMQKIDEAIPSWPIE